MKTAILIDGGFYRRRAFNAYGDIGPKERSDELIRYCQRHLKWHGDSQNQELYRIFYYDCVPLNKSVYHPLLKRNIDLSRTNQYNWSLEFYEHLKKIRKVALRLGKISAVSTRYGLTASLEFLPS